MTKMCQGEVVYNSMMFLPVFTNARELGDLLPRKARELEFYTTSELCNFGDVDQFSFSNYSTVVARDSLVEALCYVPEGHGFHSR
jgi:hypothetical protein